MERTHSFDAVERARRFNAVTPKIWRAGAYASNRTTNVVDSIAYTRAGALRMLPVGFRLFLPTMALTVDPKAGKPIYYYLMCQSIQRAAWELFTAFEESETFPATAAWTSANVANRWEEQAITWQRVNGATHVLPAARIILHVDEEKSDLGVDDLI